MNKEKLPQNPKDIFATKKVSFSKIPPIALAHLSMAMMDGAKKYSSFNWRDNAVQADIYVDALFRHVLAWFEREENAEDSGVHHLGHAMACLAILLDAEATGNLIDNRPASDGETFQKLLKDLSDQISQKSNHNLKIKLTPIAGYSTETINLDSASDYNPVTKFEDREMGFGSGGTKDRCGAY